jgi:hypothetical protein
MKKTFKIAALAIAFAGFAFGAKAQTTTNAPSSSTTTSSNGVIFSVGVEPGIPTGKLHDDYKFSIGGSVQADIPVIPNFLFATVNAGYTNIIGRNNVDGTGYDATNIQLLPVKAGLKVFPVKYFYLQGEAGAAFALNKSDLGFDKTAAFLYSPQIGIELPTIGKSYFDAGVFYQGTTKFNSAIENSKVNYVGLRLAYAFGTK